MGQDYVVFCIRNGGSITVYNKEVLGYWSKREVKLFIMSLTPCVKLTLLISLSFYISSIDFSILFP